MNFNKILIADDEPAARRKLRTLITKLVGKKLLTVNEILEASQGREAEATIKNSQPDLVFLDINMPYKTGLQVAKATDNQDYHLIFVTAYDEHAISAFETHALDYLLKPVSLDRLSIALKKVDALRQRFSPSTLQNVQQSLESACCQISIKRGNATVVINADEIGYLEALSGYCRIHLTHKGQTRHQLDTLLSDAALGHIQSQLPSEQFIKLHRSFVVNAQQVQRYFTQQRRMFIELIDYETVIPVARSNAKLIRDRWPGQ